MSANQLALTDGGKLLCGIAFIELILAEKFVSTQRHGDAEVLKSLLFCKFYRPSFEESLRLRVSALNFPAPFRNLAENLLFL